MVQACSYSALVAVLALTAALTDSATALPTHRSSSAITRRAHLASHDPVMVVNNKRTNLGDHSVYVDASTDSAAAQGGLRNSTVNLTVISNKKRDSTLTGFARVVRSLFRRSTSPTSSPSTSSSSSSSSNSSLKPRLVALPQHTAAPYTQGHRTSRRQHQAAAALSRRSKKQNQKRNVAPRIGVVVANPSQGSGRRLPPRNVKRQNNNYDLGNEQASIYAAAVAAIETASSSPDVPSPAVTAQPVALNAQQDSAAARPPITVTMTLVASGPNGEYIDAAAATATATASSSSSIGQEEAVSKVRERRSTMADRKRHHHYHKRAQQQQQEEQQRLNRRQPNPKSSTATTTTTTIQEETPAAPKWTAIARF